MFNTVLYQLRSSKNIGLIARSHIALGGNFLIIIGNKDKWLFKGGSHTYTRQLIKQNKLLFFDDFELFLNWNNSSPFVCFNIAVEITPTSCFSSQFNYPKTCNFILGNERTGLPENVIKLCDFSVTIPQYNNTGSLNVAVSASIAFYEWNKQYHSPQKATGNKF